VRWRPVHLQKENFAQFKGQSVQTDEMPYIEEKKLLAEIVQSCGG
jgi:hypothetical protein